MLRRSRAREVALQLLFQRDGNPKPVPRAAVEAFARERITDPPSIVFCLALYDGVNANRDAIDALISGIATNWRITRMMPADRNVLRLATFELRFAPKTEAVPVPVLLNEAIELSRRFGTADSPAFVNGILDKVAKTVPPPAAPTVPKA